MTTEARPSPPAAREPRRQGRLEHAARRRTAVAARAALPYVSAAGAGTLAGAVLDSQLLTGAVLGGVAVRGGTLLWEEYGWHRKGGKAAARRRRRFQGTATRRELRRRLSPAAARRHARRVYPDLDPALAAVVIGRRGRRVVAGSRADSYLVVAPPQTLKTALISCWAADAPGALLATSSRGDLYRHTAVPRSALGDVHVLNADGDRAIPSTLAWSPVAGCRNPQTAIRRAGDLMHAAPRDPSGKDAWHAERGARLLRYMLHAAAIEGASMHEVAAWVHDPLSAEPMSILAGADAHPGWADKLAALTAADGDYLSGVISSAESAIGWMDDPVLAAIATPPDGGLDIRRLIAAGNGSIYLIGKARPHGSLAPFFTALTAEAFHAAVDVAENSGGRLAVPLTMALDEVATICPVPLGEWTAVAAGYNITLIAGIQALSQLPARWGEHDARTIRTNFTTKIIGGGFTDHGDLEELSAVCGDQDTWHHVRHPDGSRTRQPEKERLFPPERIRMLPAWHALVVHRNTRPAEVTVTPVWERRGYRPAQAPAPPARRPAPEQPALTAGTRTAIPMPSGRPAPIESAGTAGAPVTIPDTPEEALTQWHQVKSG